MASKKTPAGSPKSPVTFSPEEIREIFEQLDANKDGHLTLLEVEMGARMLGVDYNVESFVRAAGRAGLDFNHDVTYREFEAFVKHQEKELNALFLKMDKDKDGYLSAKEAQETLKYFGLPQAHQALERLLGLLDEGHTADDNITADEWKKIAMFAATSAMGTNEAPIASVSHRQSLSDGLQHLLSGVAAGSAAKTVVAPLSRLKILFQVSTTKPPFFGTINKIYQDNGLRGFYRGNFANCIKSGPELGLKLITFDALKEVFTNSEGVLSPTGRFLAGGCSAILSHTITFPLAVVHARIEVTHAGSGYNGIIGTALTVYRNEGFIPTFFRGFVPMAVSTFPSNGISLGLYSYLKARLEEKQGHDLGASGLAMCSTAGGIVAEGATYPMHLIKTRLMTQGSPGVPKRYTGVVDCVNQICTTEGVAGFYRGFTPTLIKHIPSVAVTMTTYELLKKHFARPNEQRNKVLHGKSNCGL